MPLLDDVSLHIFCAGLDMATALDLNIAAGGSFAFKTLLEAKKIMDHILEKHTSSTAVSKPLHEKAMSFVEESSSVESNLIPSPSIYLFVKPPPEPQAPKEEVILRPSEFPI